MVYSVSYQSLFINVCSSQNGCRTLGVPRLSKLHILERLVDCRLHRFDTEDIARFLTVIIFVMGVQYVQHVYYTCRQ